jgi:hypothetical protein
MLEGKLEALFVKPRKHLVVFAFFSFLQRAAYCSHSPAGWYSLLCVLL